MNTLHRCFVAAAVLVAVNTGMSKGAEPGGWTDNEFNLLWKGFWGQKIFGKQLKEPTIAKLTETDAIRRLTGKWLRTKPDEADETLMLKMLIQLNANRTFEVSEDPGAGGRRCKSSGKWRVISDKIVLLPDANYPLPAYIFLVGDKAYMFDGSSEMRELKREKDGVAPVPAKRAVR